MNELARKTSIHSESGRKRQNGETWEQITDFFPAGEGGAGRVFGPSDPRGLNSPPLPVQPSKNGARNDKIMLTIKAISVFRVHRPSDNGQQFTSSFKISRRQISPNGRGTI